MQPPKVSASHRHGAAGRFGEAETHGRSPWRRRPGGPPGGGPPPPPEGGFNDIFDMFFGGAGARHARQPGPERGNDLRYDLSITFEEAAFGKTVELEVPRTV